MIELLHAFDDRDRTRARAEFVDFPIVDFSRGKSRACVYFCLFICCRALARREREREKKGAQRRKQRFRRLKPIVLRES